MASVWFSGALLNLSLLVSVAAGAAPAAPRAPKPAVKVAVRDPGGRGTRRPAKPRVLPRNASIELFHVNRHETLKLRVVDERGRAVRGLDKRMSKFLRCHHTNAEHRMDPRLVRLIHETGRHYPGRRIEVVSGYRHPTVARNPRSPHMKGLACDFRVQGIANTELRDFLRSHYQHVGVGYYPNSSFVHLDVRTGASAFWIDYSRPNEDAIYSETPAEDLRNGRADTYKPTRIDPSWADSDGAPAASVAAPAEAPPAEGPAAAAQSQ